MEKYYINDFKTNLIKVKDENVFTYNFITKEWVESDYWFNEIFFEGAIRCFSVTRSDADKIIRGEGYDVD